MTDTMSCGCKIISDNLGAYKIEYCPKHKAADDVCEALKATLWVLKGGTYARVGKPNQARPEAIEQAEQALAKAGERCIP